MVAKQIIIFKKKQSANCSNLRAYKKDIVQKTFDFNHANLSL